uniref:Uncharacterized protein n=1 Tax=Prolemur simus TaxID=1328070 RepID=A0A8C8ZZP6_PROSS
IGSEVRQALQVQHTSSSAHAVYGRESAYGGCPYPFSGIFEISPGNASELGETLKFKEAVVLGSTDLLEDDVGKTCRRTGKRIQRQCLSFRIKTSVTFLQLSQRFCVGQRPSLRQPTCLLQLLCPLLQSCLPKAGLTPALEPRPLVSAGSAASVFGSRTGARTCEICLSVPGLFHSTSCSPGPSMLLRMTGFHSFYG